MGTNIKQLEGKELVSAITTKQLQCQRIAISLHQWRIKRFMVSRWSLPPVIDSVEINGKIYRL
jgi:hypothetical protein